MREHYQNLGSMFSLLMSRRDLVETFFFTKERFTKDDFTELIHLFNTTEADVENSSLEPVHQVLFTLSKPEKLGDFTPEQLEEIAVFVNKQHIFKETVTPGMMDDFFHLHLEQPLHAVHNGTFAMFLSCLRDEQHVCNKWQKLVADAQMVISSASGKPLQHSNISSALAGYRQSHGSLDSDFISFARKLSDMLESDG